MSTKVEDVRGVDGLWLKTIGDHYTRVHTESYVKWGGMMARCKENSRRQVVSPSYVGCTVSQEFKDFQLFTDWHTKQVGYSVEGYQLDKDLLVEGNKVYSAENCVLVPKALNMFTVNYLSGRGEHPQGVHFDTTKSVYKAQTRVNGNRVHLGYYTTPEEASAVYKKAKEAEAYRWYERLKAGEFIVDERVVERMRKWTVPPQHKGLH